MGSKDWWKSKAIWTGVVTTLVGIFVPEDMKEHVVIVALGLLSIIFRWTATTTIK